jgi:uncharacterized membrane protein YqaE (UPF0057 family)
MVFLLKFLTFLIKNQFKLFMKKTLRILFLSVFIFSHLTGSFASFGKKSKEETSVNPNEVKSVPSVDAVKSAMEEFRNLSRKEKRERFKDLKKEIKQYKADRKNVEEISTNTLLLVLLAILIPPLAVYLHEGETNNRFWINVLLTILGYVLFGFAGIIFLGSLPGIIHALIIVLGGA